jgi:hypothetical protein
VVQVDRLPGRGEDLGGPGQKAVETEGDLVGPGRDAEALEEAVEVVRDTGVVAVDVDLRLGRSDQGADGAVGRVGLEVEVVPREGVPVPVEVAMRVIGTIGVGPIPAAVAVRAALVTATVVGAAPAGVLVAIAIRATPTAAVSALGVASL